MVDVVLDVYIVNNFHGYLYFCGFWVSGFYVGGGIFMLVAASKMSYVKLYLVQMFIVTLVFTLLGFMLSIVTILALETNLDIGRAVVFVLSSVHTIANIVVISISGNKTILQSTSNIQGNA